MGKKNKFIKKETSQNISAANQISNSLSNQPYNIEKNSQPQPNTKYNIGQLNKQTQNSVKPTKLIQKEVKPQNSSNQSTKKMKKSNEKKHQNSKELQRVVHPQAKIAKPNEVKGKAWSQLQYTLRGQVVEALSKCNFKTMLPVQQASIPLLLKNYDLAVEAQTGSGKTLSFLIPLLEKYLAMNIILNHKKSEQNQAQDGKEFKPVIKYLIISPTRELCQQTFNVLVKLLQNLPSKQRSQKYLKYCHCATGGSDMTTDIQKLKDSTLVFVGTIGRIRELSQHMDQNWLKKVQYLFIDEADRVLKEKGIEQLIRSVQKIRRTAMFSATLQTLNQKNFEFYGMRNLAKISLKQTGAPQNNTSSGLTSANEDKKYIIPKSLTNTYLIMPSRIQKMQFLVNFLKNNIEQKKIIVFFNTCASVDFYTKMFNSFFQLNEEQQIVGLHGKLKTNRRQKLIKIFMKKFNGCLFATDVVSRGIDFDHIHFILQVDPPEDPDNYVHRIGRTARINRPGTAILLIEQHEEAFINYLAQKSVGVQEISDPTHYYSKNGKIETITQIAQKMDSIMRTDRDYVEKSKKAFVSYIRSYKEHDLRYIFEFKNLDIGKTAQSFFMYRIPRIKQILGKSISSFTQSTVDIEAIPWLDKNQQLQYSKKKEKREQQLLEKKKLEKRLMKNMDAKNNKSKRKRIKAKMETKFLSNLNKEHRQLLKSKTQSGRTAKHKDQDLEEQGGQEYDFNDSEDTEQIEQRMTNNNKIRDNNKSQKNQKHFIKGNSSMKKQQHNK